jgi:exodeoxyribonuclease V alpha subunit
MTVHKSQGSEFASVSFVPAPVGNPLAARELVYTAVTRAREHLRIWGRPEELAAAAGTRVARHSGLGQRLA